MPDLETDHAFGPGVYCIVVNLHNANRSEPADVVVRVIEAPSIANPSPSDKGRVQRTLDPDEAIFFNCRAVQRTLGAAEDAAAKVDGCMIIRSDRRLDALAVYSAVPRTPDVPNEGITLDVEHIRERVVRRGRRENAEE